MYKYVHDTEIHHSKDAEYIVPILIKMFAPGSVVDVGCGLGTFMKEFINAGINDVTGIEGTWLDISKLVVDKERVILSDLEQDFNLKRRFDLAVCLEVVEHLDENKAAQLVSTLVSLSDIIIFSAAIPYQGGQNHVNEQWIEYWQFLFNQHHYKFYDVIRSHIWNNRDIYWWYRQNIMVCINSAVEHQFEDGPVNNYIHPELYLSKVGMLNSYKEWIDKIFSGDIEVEIAQAILENAKRVRGER
jgi:SAM-dependent methyltransferase